jgi:hypothetical protein
MEIGTKVRDLGDGEEDYIISGIVDHSLEESRDIQLENISLKNLIQKTTREIEELPVTCGPSFPQKLLACGSIPSFPDDHILFGRMILTDEELRYQRMSKKKDVAETVEGKHEEPVPPVMEIGTKVHDLGDGEENDIISGIVDHSMEESSDIQLENIDLKNLIQKTTLEIEELPVTCGPSFPQKLVACGSIPSFPDDHILVERMILTDEELRYQRMSELRASRGANESLDYQPPSEPSGDVGQPL